MAIGDCRASVCRWPAPRLSGAATTTGEAARRSAHVAEASATNAARAATEARRSTTEAAVHSRAATKTPWASSTKAAAGRAAAMEAPTATTMETTAATTVTTATLSKSGRSDAHENERSNSCKKRFEHGGFHHFQSPSTEEIGCSGNGARAGAGDAACAISYCRPMGYELEKKDSSLNPLQRPAKCAGASGGQK